MFKNISNLYSLSNNIKLIAYAFISYLIQFMSDITQSL